MRNRRRRLRMNCFGCGKFWSRKRQTFCELFRFPFKYTKEELETRKVDLEERLRNINRKLNQIGIDDKPSDLHYGGKNE